MYKSLLKYGVYYPVLLSKCPSYFSARYFFEKSQYFDRNTQEKATLKKIHDIIEYCRKHVPAYKKLLGDITASDINSLSCMQKLPVVTKKMLKDEKLDFRSKERHSLTTIKTTGGSTGQPVTIIKSRYAMGLELAATWRGYSWAGINIGDKQARFWGTPLSKKGKFQAGLIDFVCHRQRFSAFAYSHQALQSYTEKLKKFKPDYYYGYVSMLNEYADYIKENKITFESYPKAIITTAEILSEEVRYKLESVFHTSVYNEYGCGELGTIAHECQEGGLHLSTENMYVEILDNKGNYCSPGQLGEIIVTELNNTAMPLIRYQLGDLGMLSSESCKCGKGLPTLKDIKGRSYETIKLEDGRMFHGEFFMYIFEGAKRRGLGVAQFQVIQSARNSFNIKLVITSNEGKEALEGYITSEIKAVMGNKLSIEYDYVDNIPRQQSGKMLLIKALHQ